MVLEKEGWKAGTQPRQDTPLRIQSSILQLYILRACLLLSGTMWLPRVPQAQGHTW